MLEWVLLWTSTCKEELHTGWLNSKIGHKIWQEFNLAANVCSSLVGRHNVFVSMMYTVWGKWKMLQCWDWSTETEVQNWEESHLLVSSALLTHRCVFWDLLGKQWMSPSARSWDLRLQQALLHGYAWCHMARPNHNEWANHVGSVLLLLMFSW